MARGRSKLFDVISFDWEQFTKAQTATRNNSVVMYDEVGSAKLYKSIGLPSFTWSPTVLVKPVWARIQGFIPTSVMNCSDYRYGWSWLVKDRSSGSSLRSFISRLIKSVESVPYFEHMKEQINGDSLGDYQELCNQYYPSAQNEKRSPVLKGPV